MRAGPGAEDREGMNGAVTDSSQVGGGGSHFTVADHMVIYSMYWCRRLVRCLLQMISLKHYL